MILQYDDIVNQVVTRLEAVIPQSPKRLAQIEYMQNGQAQIAGFFKSQERGKIMVTYSGNNVEGGRDISDYGKSLNETTQDLTHTIEVHICSKYFMRPANHTGDDASILKLSWLVRRALTGLHFFQRDNAGALRTGAEWLACEKAMFHIETIFDRNYEGSGAVAICRFQVMERIPQDEALLPEAIYGTYQEIHLQEYAQQTGDIENIGGEPNTETTFIVTGETE